MTIFCRLFSTKSINLKFAFHTGTATPSLNHGRLNLAIRICHMGHSRQPWPVRKCWILSQLRQLGGSSLSKAGVKLFDLHISKAAGRVCLSGT